MEVKEGQVTLPAFAIYVKTKKNCEEKTDLREVVFNEGYAKIELNEVLDTFHGIYGINDPFKYERRFDGKRVSYKCLTLDNSDFEFWYDSISIVEEGP